MVYVVLYLLAIVLANISVSAFGPSIIIVNSLILIGLDLTVRDKLHDYWQGNNLILKMSGLIITGSILSWLLNNNTKSIAVASFVAFGLAAIVDTIIYHLLRNQPQWIKINGSNIPSAAVDSLIFPTLAFGGFLWPIIIGQFLTKVFGGFIWSQIFIIFQTKTITNELNEL